MKGVNQESDEDKDTKTYVEQQEDARNEFLKALNVRRITKGGGDELQLK